MPVRQEVKGKWYLINIMDEKMRKQELEIMRQRALDRERERIKEDFIIKCRTCNEAINTNKQTDYEICFKCKTPHHRSCLKIMCHNCCAVYCPKCAEGLTHCEDCGEEL